MKKLFIFAAALFLFGAADAQTTLEEILPLLQKQDKTTLEVENIANTFVMSKDPNLTFASGAALVQSPPSKESAMRFLNLIISSQDGLKKIFSSVILVAMDQKYIELLAMLEDAVKSQDPMIRAYAATACIIIDPQRTDLADQAFALYPFSKAFALKAFNSIYPKPEKIISGAKKASASSSYLTRSGAAEVLGDLGSEKEQKTLFKMLKKEDNTMATSAIARAIARHPQAAVKEAKKCLSAKSNTAYAFGCSLTVGFMTDKGLPLIKEGFASKKADERANALRATSVMANVLSDPNAIFSTDINMDRQNLKELIPAVIQLSLKDPDNYVKGQAESAILELKKLLK